MWIGLSLLQITGFCGTLLAQPGDAAFALICIAVAGLGSSGGLVIGMSMLADVADYEEYRFGERREGIHYSAINIARKFSAASLAWMVGLALSSTGYVANAQQTESAVDGIRWLFAAIPTTGSVVAIALLLAYRLTESEHRRIRAALSAR